MTHLTLGEPAPWFVAATAAIPRFHFSSVAGRFVLLGFLPNDRQVRLDALSALAGHRDLFDDAKLCCFLVTREAEAISKAVDELGMRWFLDADGAISRAYGALSAEGGEAPMWMLLDPALRVCFHLPIDQAALALSRCAGLPAVDRHAGVQLNAPVLIVPRVFEAAMCQRLIDHYEGVGGQESGVMREVGGKTVGLLSDNKRRRDADIADPDFRQALRARVNRRLLPEIQKAFQFTATRIERYIVACYDAGEGGFFRPHRDNTTAGTAHRKFAVSINLNAEGFEGGDLCFPEFGGRTYRPPTGGAVVFSCSLMHEARPVTRGRRYAFLPFLYDEAGEALRTENLHLLQQPSAANVAEAPAGSQADAG